MTLDTPDLLALGTDLEWPTVRLGRLVIRGERGWRDALGGFPPVTRPERRMWLAQLHRPLLVARPNGRERLRRWVAHERTQPSPIESATALRRRLWEDLAYYGDEEMLPHVVEALALAPQPVRDSLLSEVAFLGLGWSSDGFTMPLRFIGPDGHERRTGVLLNGAHRDGDGLVHVVLHELGHAWNVPLAEDVLSTMPAITACGRRHVRALAERDGWAAHAWALHAREEAHAEACAHVWRLRRTVTPWR